VVLTRRRHAADFPELDKEPDEKKERQKDDDVWEHGAWRLAMTW
jgi:hypothetical protein